jgi:ABC-type uncharacterized transport system auxiliary subunit
MIRHIRIAVRATACTAAALSLAACALGGETRYRLIDPQIDPPERSQTNDTERRLAVARPLADQTRDSSRILVRRDRSLMPWAQGAWIDRAPDLVRAELVEFLDGGWGTVGAYGELPSEHRLDLVLERFELVADGSEMSAEVTLTVRLFNAQGELQDVLRPSALEPVAESDSLDSAVRAMEAAMRSTFVELQAWLDARVAPPQS